MMVRQGFLKRATSFMLALVMAFGLLGIYPSAFAADTALEEETVPTVDSSLQPLYQEIVVSPGQLIGETCEIVESEIYGYVVDYALKKGHTLSISDTNYVFSVRVFSNGNYSTMLKQATTASFTATEDITVGMLIRKPDKSALTAEELADVVIYDTLYGMKDVEGYAHRFTVEAETIDGGTATTRANIFLPKSYTADGDPTRLIVMTNGHSAYLTDSVWNKNTADNVGIIRNYLNAGYAVYVVDNTAGRTSQTPDIGCPQLVSSYRKAYEYIQQHFNVEEKISIHSRSFGTFAAVRLMKEIPELIKCAVMTGARVSVKQEWPGLDKVHIANRFGFTDTTGATYEADKMVGHDPYVDVDGDSYALPPTYWVLCEGDATAKPLEFIDKLATHGNDVSSIIHTGTDHTGVCTLNTEAMFADALEFLNAYQENNHSHTYENGICAGCGAYIPNPEWELGTIASATGADNATNSRMRTVGYHKLSDFAGVGINSGYTMTNFVYDENFTYLGTSSWLGSGIPFTIAALTEKYPMGVYFRVVFRTDDQKVLTQSAVADSGVRFYQNGEEMPTPDYGFTFEDIGSIGVWQDGSIWDGKLFALGAAGTGAVFDVKSGTKLGDLTLDGKDVLKPHANSVCFGSTYYAEGDKYPLLYVNIYNNYASSEDRMEGTCCVYRITESEKGFETDLVQVIKIGFVEDLTLWKSKENNGDVRPYGNFVVDTDANKLYAYVMRDANKSTRFFCFDIPGLSEGAYNENYGCNVVTLETDAIKAQFDSEYYYYLQGCCYSSGMILYVGDFGGDAPLCVVDLESQTIKDVVCLGYAGLRAEPEVLCADPADGTLYYAAADGVLRAITLNDIHLHAYQSTVTPPTCTEQGYTTYTCACEDSYVDDYVDATGEHTYENGICAGCGAERLNAETITLGDFVVAKVGKKALEESTVQLSQKTLIAVPFPGAELTLSIQDGYQACVYSGNNNNRIDQNSGWLGTDGDNISFYTCTLPQSTIYMRVSLRKTDGSVMTSEDLTSSGLTVSYVSTSDVVQDNADAADILENTDLPVLIHISDIHGDVIRAERAAQFADAVGADALLASGDLTAYEPDDWGNALFDVFAKYPVNTLYGIGNHDVRGYTSAQYDETAYNTYYKDYYLTSDGTTYYYQDLTTQKLRIISVNQVEGAESSTLGGTCFSQDQVNWLVDTLKTTPAGYGVVLMYHSPEANPSDSMDSNYPKFFQESGRVSSTTTGYTKYTGTLLADVVDAFMMRKTLQESYSEGDGSTPVTVNADFTDVAQGVEFIAHVTGHVHADTVTYLPGTICKQLILGVTCTTAMYGEDGGYGKLADVSDLTRDANAASQDAFNAYLIDRENKSVRVLRVGAKTGNFNGLRDDMTIPYSIPAEEMEEVEYPFDTTGMVKFDLNEVEWVNYGYGPSGPDPAEKPGKRCAADAVFDVPYDGVTFYVKINSPYEMGIRSGKTDTEMTNHGYWLNNKSFSAAEHQLGYSYTIPAGDTRFVIAVGKLTRSSSSNYTNKSITVEDMVEAGVEIWYKPQEHSHIYTPTVTAPTCTEQGYTTYTCTCGDSYVDDYVDAAGHSYKNDACTVCGEAAPSFEGKTISILGDSISTFSGVSNSTAYNSTIGSNAVYYSGGTLGVYRADTWWQQTIDALGMELLVNNSWSGSTVFYPRKGESSVGYGDRCVNLHNDTTGEEPDVIVVFLGTNDFSYYQSTLGTADIDYSALITDDGYAAPTTTCEAYAIMLHKMAERYPDAEIYCMSMTARRSPDKEDSYADVGQPTAFNAELKAIVGRFGATYVDLENCGIDADAEIFDTYMGDGRVHPNALGMDKITEALVSAMLGQDAQLYTVSYSLNGVSSDQSAQSVLSGNSYTASLTLLDNYSEMDVTVTMGGVDITADCYSNGVISVSEVTGDIAVTAIGTLNKKPESYRWEFDGSALVSTGDTENTPAKQAGTITDGVFSGVRYSLETPVLLAHDANWVVEWKCSGDWSGMLLTSTATSATTGMEFIFRTYNATGLLAIGEYSGQYNNYGIALADLGLDMTAAHTYRLENRIADDGSNMVYLIIDGTEIGALNHYYVGGTSNQNKTVDWVSGKDFVFGYIGSTSHPLKNMALEYISVTECDHAYENGICTACGAEHPNLANYEGKVISILGDSISTFAGYIPVADGFNLEHYARYPQDNLFTEVEHTWWMQVLTALDAKLGINESWRSTEVYNYIDAEVNSSYDGTKACMASITRIQNLGSNGTPDVILFFGGTNDITQSRPVGTFDSSTAPTEVDLTSVKWDNVADAYVDAIMRMQHYYPDAQIIAMLPFDRSSQGTDKVDQYNSLFISICEHYGVTYVDLRECGISTSDLPDGTHPDATGMDYITAAVMDVLMSDCNMEAGEHIVHSITYNLTGAESSLSYYKGVSYGNSFETTITGENLEVAVTMGGVDVTEACYANGVVFIENVTGDLVITASGTEKTIYEDYLQELPENFCSGTNLWAALTPINLYYTGNGWGNTASGSVYSITIPVAARDQLWATAFQKSGTNGGTRNGIRLTWFDENGVLESVSPDNVYAQFFANGYLAAPEGAVAVNVVMWNGDDSNELYILDRDHIYENGICTICGAEHPNLANFEGKVVSILGDSISTFVGYIPVADGFNLEHLARYPQDDLLTDVNETWWMQVISELDAKLGINDSWRGATVSGAVPVTTGTTGENAAMGNLTRVQNLGANGTPDVILFYGGTNDLAHVSKVGSFDPDTAPATVDLTTKKWDNLADGYVHTLLRLRHYYPDAAIVAMLPTYTKSYYSTNKLAQANAVLAQICEHYGVAYVDLRDCGLSTSDLPDGIHPDANGMDCISEAVVEVLLDNCEMKVGENVVHSVTHKLIGAESALSYYKGVTHGKPFVTAITGENVTVSVTMGGADITDAVYANGVVTIAQVTGDLVLTAEGYVKPVYADHLQQLPEDTCSGTNLWAALEHDAQYYTVDGWGTHSSGTVYSVTFPVSAGERIYATSFGAAGENGSSINGIRVTWFDEDGLLKTVSADKVYDEFSVSGYLTAPEGAAAVSIPMWKVSDANEIYILNREHTYTALITAPTCTEQGYTTHTCTLCGDSYVDSYVDALEHKEVVDEAMAPSCTESGLTEGKHCSVCQTITVKQDTVDALGHQFSCGLCIRCDYDTVEVSLSDSLISIHTTELIEGTWLFVASYNSQGKLLSLSIAPWKGDFEQEIPLSLEEDASVVRIFFLAEAWTPLRTERKISI